MDDLFVLNIGQSDSQSIKNRLFLELSLVNVSNKYDCEIDSFINDKCVYAALKSEISERKFAVIVL